MNIGYLSVQDGSASDFINWDLLRSLPEVRSTDFFHQVRAPQPLDIRMNGKKRLALVTLRPDDADEAF